MIYLIEFALLHLLFYGVYKLTLSKETQLAFLRSFLIGSTFLSLLVPAISIPNTSVIPTINTEAIILPSVSVIQSQEHTHSVNWVEVIFTFAAIVMTIRLLIMLSQLRNFYKRSSYSEIENIPVRKVLGLQNSFTFFRWIFIDPDYFENPKDIVRHEYGHVQKLHSLDLTFFYLMTIPFWWLPSIWLMIKELKKVHEFEADQYAISLSKETYIKTLVRSTLKAHGMNLASSFDDAPIFNRLKFIKKMKKKMNPWKIVSTSTILAISAAMFACEEQLESEIEQIVEESNQQLEYSDEVEAALVELSMQYPDQEFTVVETKIENEESIRLLQSYDPEQITHMFVNEDGDEKSVVMIVNKSSDLFEKSIEIQEATYEQGRDGVFTITDETASFPGGLDAYYEYLGKELTYPEQAKKLGVEGRVFVEFVIETDGSIGNAKVVKGIGAGCDAEALRVIKESPKWIPGKVNGKPVRQRMIHNIAFNLS